MPVDSFKYLSRLVSRYYKMARVDKELPLPWTPLQKPLQQCRFSLVTSGGLYHPDLDPPFDMEREQEEPTWGDPTFRTLPTDRATEEIAVSHQHIYEPNVEEDINILLPIDRFHELVDDGTVGSLAPHAYSFMGYQGIPPNMTPWKEEYGPQVARQMAEEEVDCVLLTTA